MTFYYQNGDVKIYTNQQYLPAFKQMIVLREQELKKIKPDDPIYGNFLKTIYPIYSNDKNNIQGIIFERMEDTSTRDAARILEGYRWEDEVTLKIEIAAQNGLASIYDEDRQKYPNSYGNSVPQKLDQMHKLFTRISPRDDLTIPTEPGVCLLNSFMKGVDKEWKDISYSYYNETIDDFYFSFNVNNYAGDIPLLDTPDWFITGGKGRIIHKDTRNSNELLLEELIAKGKFFVGKDGFDSDEQGYIFLLGINMTDPTDKAPQLNVKMYYIIPTDGSVGYSEDQLMVIWREITNSIKLRNSAYKTE